MGDTVATAKSKITLLGYHNRYIPYQQLSDGLEVKFPPLHDYLKVCGEHCKWAYVLKMENVKSRMLLNEVRVNWVESIEFGELHE